MAYAEYYNGYEIDIDTRPYIIIVGVSRKTTDDYETSFRIIFYFFF